MICIQIYYLDLLLKSTLVISAKLSHESHLNGEIGDTCHIPGQVKRSSFLFCTSCSYYQAYFQWREKVVVLNKADFFHVITLHDLLLFLPEIISTKLDFCIYLILILITCRMRVNCK